MSGKIRSERTRGKGCGVVAFKGLSGEPAEPRLIQSRRRDVDVLNEPTIRKYISDDPQDPIPFSKGQIADAESAVAGWRMAVDDLFR